MKSKTTLFVLASLLGAGVLAKAEDAPKGPPPERKIPAELIKKFDKDGDGKLNEDERAALRAAGEGKKAEFEKKMIEKFDKDGDGKLSEEEKKAARPDRPMVPPEILKEFDKDGDGKLNEDERAAAGAAREKKMIEKFDKDGDGKLSDEEKKAARESFGPGGPRGRDGKGPKGPDAPPPAGN